MSEWLAIADNGWTSKQQIAEWVVTGFLAPPPLVVEDRRFQVAEKKKQEEEEAVAMAAEHARLEREGGGGDGDADDADGDIGTTAGGGEANDGGSSSANAKTEAELEEEEKLLAAERMEIKAMITALKIQTKRDNPKGALKMKHNDFVEQATRAHGAMKKKKAREREKEAEKEAQALASAEKMKMKGPSVFPEGMIPSAAVLCDRHMLPTMLRAFIDSVDPSLGHDDCKTRHALNDRALEAARIMQQRVDDLVCPPEEIEEERARKELQAASQAENRRRVAWMVVKDLAAPAMLDMIKVSYQRKSVTDLAVLAGAEAQALDMRHAAARVMHGVDRKRATRDAEKAEKKAKAKERGARAGARRAGKGKGKGARNGAGNGAGRGEGGGGGKGSEARKALFQDFGEDDEEESEEYAEEEETEAVRQKVRRLTGPGGCAKVVYEDEDVAREREEIKAAEVERLRGMTFDQRELEKKERALEAAVEAKEAKVREEKERAEGGGEGFEDGVGLKKKYRRKMSRKNPGAPLVIKAVVKKREVHF